MARRPTARLGGAVALAVLVATCAPDAARVEFDPGVPAVVRSVVDGDTLVLDDPGRTHLRLAGVNAPEAGECLSEMAAAGLAALAGPGSTIDTTARGTDRFGRVLAEVFTSAGSVNERLVERGLAVSMAGADSLAGRMRAAEERARQARRGLWDPRACGSGAVPDVRIAALVADPAGPDGEPGSDELVTVVNHDAGAVDLSGWVLRDESSVHRFRFPPGTTLAPGGAVSVGSGCEPAPGMLAWCEGPVWNNAGDTAFLLDPNGAIAHWLRHDPPPVR